MRVQEYEHGLSAQMVITIGKKIYAPWYSKTSAWREIIQEEEEFEISIPRDGQDLGYAVLLTVKSGTHRNIRPYDGGGISHQPILFTPGLHGVVWIPAPSCSRSWIDDAKLERWLKLELGAAHLRDVKKIPQPKQVLGNEVARWCTKNTRVMPPPPAGCGLTSGGRGENFHVMQQEGAELQNRKQAEYTRKAKYARIRRRLESYLWESSRRKRP
ncbi:hypothetical protein B0H11DRAFT_1901358 [Mycena galericulata]|nr:hypothetical protein B0H11DRAFT_1901358 [Mycena galericulata]